MKNQNSKSNFSVRVFSTPTCAYCFTLKEFLKEHNIKFEDIDVSQNQGALKEMVEKSGQMGVPVIEINGQVIVGFNKARIVELLNLND